MTDATTTGTHALLDDLRVVPDQAAERAIEVLNAHGGPCPDTGRHSLLPGAHAHSPARGGHRRAAALIVTLCGPYIPKDLITALDTASPAAVDVFLAACKAAQE